MGAHHVVVAALRKGGEVLLCHRSPDRLWYPDVWDFPGGHIEDDEQPNDALRRELLEEIGVDIGSISRPPELELSGQEAGFELSLWVVDDWRGEIHNLQPEEHDDLGWFRTSDLASLTFADDAYRSFLAALLSR